MSKIKRLNNASDINQAKWFKKQEFFQKSIDEFIEKFCEKEKVKLIFNSYINMDGNINVRTYLKDLETDIIGECNGILTAPSVDFYNDGRYEFIEMDKEDSEKDDEDFGEIDSVFSNSRNSFLEFEGPLQEDGFGTNDLLFQPEEKE
jgi:hypothetical protein